jgi:hypothetical protein
LRNQFISIDIGVDSLHYSIQSQKRRCKLDLCIGIGFASARGFEAFGSNSRQFWLYRGISQADMTTKALTLKEVNAGDPA